MMNVRIVAVRLFAPVLLLAPNVGLHAQTSHPISAQAEYTWVHTNLQPGCNCFGTQGGSGELLAGLSPRLAMLVDVNATHRGGLTPSAYSLTQVSYSAGLRYIPIRPRHQLQPFGEVLLGAAHASGTLSPASTGFGGNTAFALMAGGGLAIPLGERWSLIPAHADYLLTTFSNGNANRQNDVRLSAGLQFVLRR